VAERESQQPARDAVLSIDALKKAIKEALPLGLTSLKWTGGEPTLHPQFPELLQVQKNNGLSGVIETNGMLVTGALADLMMAANIMQVSVSLDSADAAVHDDIRGVAGSFKRTVSGIESLVSAGFHPEVILTLQRANQNELPNLFALAEELGAGSVKLNVLQPVLRGEQLLSEGEALSVREVLDIGSTIQSEYAESISIPIHLDLPMAFRPLSKVLSGDQDGCCKILNIIGVLPRGEYALCGVGQHVPELAMGDVMTSSLQRVWSSHPVLQQVRKGLPGRLEGICSQCLMKSACLGSCIAANYQLSGNLLAPYWFCEQAYAEKLFPESRQA
jgi:SynChlorMet cassette radical SAM/SPASM protein ScmF